MKKLGLLLMPLMAIPFLVSCGDKVFTITWKNYDGTILEEDKNVKNGIIPSYDGAIPDKPYDTNHYYSFAGWDPEIKEATKSQTYTAQYREIDITGIDAYIRISIPDDAEEKTVTFECESDSTPIFDWGDGSNYTTESHTYQQSGDYDVKIRNVTSVFINTGNDYVVELFLNDNIELIDGHSFRQSHFLTSVTIGKKANHDSFGTNPFSYCPLLSKIVVNKDNPHIDSRDNCNALISKEDGEYFDANILFSGCNSTIIPNTVTQLGQYAFSGSGITSITIPCGIKSFGESPFSGCANLNEIVVDKNNELFDSRDNCNAVVTTKEINDESIPANTIIIGCNATTIPNTVTSIGQLAFWEGSIEEIIIPNSVTSIGSSAFELCESLTSVTIPNSVYSIGSSAFMECSSLTLVDLTTYTNANEIPILTDGEGYPFKHCNLAKFKVASEEMANTFKNCGKNWPGDLDSYTWPGK